MVDWTTARSLSTRSSIRRSRTIDALNPIDKITAKAARPRSSASLVPSRRRLNMTLMIRTSGNRRERRNDLYWAIRMNDRLSCVRILLDAPEHPRRRYAKPPERHKSLGHCWGERPAGIACQTWVLSDIQL